MSSFERYIVRARPNLGLPTERRLLLTKEGDHYQLRDFHSKTVPPTLCKDLVQAKFPHFRTWGDLKFKKLFFDDTEHIHGDDFRGVDRRAYWHRRLTR